MGAFTAVELYPRAIYNHIPWIFYLNGLVLGQTFISLYSFSQATPFGVLGVVLKRTEMFVCGGGTLHLLPLDSSGKMDVLGHDGDSLCMDGA